jgi:hypothetical protein
MSEVQASILAALKAVESVRETGRRAAATAKRIRERADTNKAKCAAKVDKTVSLIAESRNKSHRF